MGAVVVLLGVGFFLAVFRLGHMSGKVEEMRECNRLMKEMRR